MSALRRQGVVFFLRRSRPSRPLIDADRCGWPDMSCRLHRPRSSRGTGPRCSSTSCSCAGTSRTARTAIRRPIPPRRRARSTPRCPRTRGTRRRCACLGSRASPRARRPTSTTATTPPASGSPLCGNFNFVLNHFPRVKVRALRHPAHAGRNGLLVVGLWSACMHGCGQGSGHGQGWGGSLVPISTTVGEARARTRRGQRTGM